MSPADMSDFNWVAGISNCSPAKILETLKPQFSRDVEDRQNVRTEREKQFGVNFAFGEDVGIFSVIVSNILHQKNGRLFSASDSEITVADLGNKPLLHGIPTLSDEGECKIKVAEVEYQFWQFRRMALEGLFFGLPADNLI